uniref:ATP-dependent DNA helicase n=1 Tax=Tanacetum cinerariifolium TaxID=118510 RepID=A0A699J7W2_TANCI|nr:ATP-dependent DNA helicase PIF1-like [Tanacetum cinerariifolium]
MENTIYCYLMQRSIVLNVASSGIASLLLPGGRTAHSRFGIPINVNETSVFSITHGSDLAALLGKTKLIIWDEAPMMNKHCFEALDRTLRDILCVSNIPFGGKVIVFGGDFRQILPVITGGTRQDIVNASFNSSYLWDHINVLKLTKNMRLKNSSGSSNNDDIKEFADWILKVGDGRLGGPNYGEAVIDIPEDILIKDCDDPVEKVYLSSDSICESEGLNDNFNESLYSPDVLNGMKLVGLPNHRLRIKELGDRAIKAEILTGTKVGETVSLFRFKLTRSDKILPLQINRRQLPIYVCFAMTINKSQGQSLSKVGIYFPKPVFTHGQLYVAVSRVTSRKRLKMLAYDKHGNVCSETMNVVYPEVLQKV